MLEDKDADGKQLALQAEQASLSMRNGHPSRFRFNSSIVLKQHRLWIKSTLRKENLEARNNGLLQSELLNAESGILASDIFQRFTQRRTLQKHVHSHPRHVRYGALYGHATSLVTEDCKSGHGALNLKGTFKC